MAIETEIKLKVASHAAVRDQLTALGAMRLGSAMELNVFFDTPDRALLAQDRGLRLRTTRDLKRSGTTHVVTYKGPRQAGPVKRREEIEFSVDGADAAAQVFAALGYQKVLAFEKRRESWKFGDCKIELDEVPHLGTFVEIEGDDERTVMSVRGKLDLDDSESVADSYIALLMKWREQNKVADPEIRF